MIAHNDINNDLRFLAQSEIRLKILSELEKHPNNVRGIVNKTNITYSSVSNNINKLESGNYIEKVNNKYHINPMTEIYFQTLMEFKNSIEMIRDYDSFWNYHNLELLNIESIRNITDLKDSKLIETTPVDIYKTHNTIKKQLIESENVKAIFPYVHPEYPGIIEEILKNEGSVELIIPQGIYRKIILSIDENIRKPSMRKRQLNVTHVKNNLNLYLTICDETMSLGLFKDDGSFDQNRILISNNPKSHSWAEELFENIKGKVIL